MAIPRGVNRRTVLKTLGAGAIGGTVITGVASAHGGGGRDFRFPTWFEGGIWEMTARPPAGPEPTDDNSHAPLWHIDPGADDTGCAQVPGFDFSDLEMDPRFADDKWGDVDYDQTASSNPFSTLWHVKFVFDDEAVIPYTPDDLVNEDQNGDPLIDTSTIDSATNVNIVGVPFVFNCPIRPADEEHSNYCGL